MILDFNFLRSKLGRFNQTQVDGINIILDKINQFDELTIAQAAYIFATAWHETAATMEPVEEYGKGKGRAYGTWFKNSKGSLYSFTNGSKKTAYIYDDFPFLYYGRGFVQLTWFDNYSKAGALLNVDFCNNPSLVMQPSYSADILVLGMIQGWFTGRKLSDFINDKNIDFLRARKIINGMDKASKIAAEAEIFKKALS